MTRPIPPWLAPVLERLELDRWAVADARHRGEIIAAIKSLDSGALAEALW